MRRSYKANRRTYIIIRTRYIDRRDGNITHRLQNRVSAEILAISQLIDDDDDDDDFYFVNIIGETPRSRGFRLYYCLGTFFSEKSGIGLVDAEIDEFLLNQVNILTKCWCNRSSVVVAIGFLLHKLPCTSASIF